MLYLISFLLLFIPTVFQYIMGNKALNKSISTNYIVICILSFFMQLIFTFISFITAIFAITNSGIKCATGAVGIIPISIIISLFMILIIIFQLIRKNQQPK